MDLTTEMPVIAYGWFANGHELTELFPSRRSALDFEAAQGANIVALMDAQPRTDALAAARANRPIWCERCDGTGEVKDLANADAEYVGDPSELRDCTPMIECGACEGTGEQPQPKQDVLTAPAAVVHTDTASVDAVSDSCPQLPTPAEGVVNVLGEQLAPEVAAYLWCEYYIFVCRQPIIIELEFDPHDEADAVPSVKGECECRHPENEKTWTLTYQSDFLAVTCDACGNKYRVHEGCPAQFRALKKAMRGRTR